MELAVVLPRSRYASELEERSSESEREDSGNVACRVCGREDCGSVLRAVSCENVPSGMEVSWLLFRVQQR